MVLMLCLALIKCVDRSMGRQQQVFDQSGSDSSSEIGAYRAQISIVESVTTQHTYSLHPSIVAGSRGDGVRKTDGERMHRMVVFLLVVCCYLLRMRPLTTRRQ